MKDAYRPEALADRAEPAALRPILARYLGGGLSPAMALMYLMLETRQVDVVEAALEGIRLRARREDGQGQGAGPLLDRLEEIQAVIRENRPGCLRVGDMLGSEMDSDALAPSVEAGIAFSRRLFNWSVSQNPETSVALYSFGNPELLDAATREVVDHMRGQGLLGSDKSALEIGCGIGRFQAALAPEVGEAHGIDVSPKMVEEARRRCAGFGNVVLSECPGADLRQYPDARFDLLFAVDSFPYLFQSGMTLVETHFLEAARVLRPGGDFLLFNFSYRDDLERDREDVARLALQSGFTLVGPGEKPFALWDGAVFRLLKKP